ncbi:sulfurtransferase TusA family protein [Sulfuracidifex metallicus]|uniref:Response regulator SirA n=1 Tax=Sulfuracidifex metallicus DSM 6482 = JCM 9184 TaxID=523847 RepID=A0A6A9QL61_SULME|nr:sulfurtransferase TusA family protein [Sulfuracidifex metallicus]MUN29020.1 response regulator SirA [Sulfuracidifex metallicus DSM 6482 = JCM 9184]WOE50470.1 sulfurtransferase TusA family protein [Sulfuracidifex metallicus DSM 6482 = JCM 9184]
MSEELKTKKPDEVVDVRGESCPIPEMTAGKKLKKMKVGQVLEILTDHQPAVDVTLPSLAKSNGYPYTIIKEGEVYKFRIQKVS